jgi:hypothetical protein
LRLEAPGRGRTAEIHWQGVWSLTRRNSIPCWDGIAGIITRAIENTKQKPSSQLSDHKGVIEDRDLRRAWLMAYATSCGEVLARGHARSGNSAVLTGDLGTTQRWDKALARFALSYASTRQLKDYESFRRAIRSGKIKSGRAYL